MSIRIQCATCGRVYGLKAELAGKKVKCKCGHTILVGAEQAALSGLDDLDDLTDVARQAAALPTLTSAATSASDVARSSTASRRAQRNSQKLIQVAGMAAAGVLAAAVVMAIAVAIIRERKPGYTSPEDALAAYQRALGGNKWNDLYRTLDESSGEKMLRTMVARVLPLAESREEIKAVLEKHCGNVPVVKAPDFDSPDFDFSEHQAFRVQVQEHSESLVAAAPDKAEFFEQLVVAIRDAEERFMPHNAVLKALARKPSNTCRLELAKLPKPALKRDGDTARGAFSVTLGGTEYDGEFVFRKTGDRWFLNIADPLEFASGLVGCTFAASGVFYSPL